jgi:hypothetical protein
MKARNAPLYNFDLNERFDIAQFRDPDQTDRTTWPTKDELLMLELQCQSLGLKLEPTASKEFDKKKRSEVKQVVKDNNVDEQKLDAIVGEVDDDKPTTKTDEVVERPVASTNSLLFSVEDAIPLDFSKLTVTAKAVSLLKDNALYEDTV